MERLNKNILLNTLIFLSVTISIVLDFNENWLYYIFKPLTTILVILLPVLAKRTDKIFRLSIILALCFCLLGDVLLLDANYFVFGLASFLIGHLLFAKAFMGLIGFQRKNKVALVLLLIGVGLYAWLYPNLGVLKLPVAVYILAILFMAWQGIGLYVVDKTKAHKLITIGVILFMFSDSMIAVNKFKTPFELSGLIILVSYWLAITLIANASLMILKRDQALSAN